MTWFPANNHPTDKASYDFTLTVPKGRTAVANGVLLGQRTAHGRTTFRWRQSEPMAAYLATATVGTFKVEQYTTRDGLKVYNAVDPREATAAAPVAEEAAVRPGLGEQALRPLPVPRRRRHRRPGPAGRLRPGDPDPARVRPARPTWTPSSTRAPTSGSATPSP